jgi:isoleucyl-tRNA synthetase
MDCIVVLNIILECLLKCLAPIFVFTTEEISNLINKNEKSIHETTFPEIPQTWKNEILSQKWVDLHKIKQEVNFAIEEKRSSKEIGSSLEADLIINVNKKEFELLEGVDLEEYFITSNVEKVLNQTEGKTKIEVKKSIGRKCTLCWKILEKKCERKNCGIK